MTTPSTPLTSRLCLDDFLSLDGPTGTVVNINDSRQAFFRHLGLREQNYRHRYLYRRMKAEAKEGMQRLFVARASLSVNSPYTPDLVTHAIFRQQVRVIHDTASPQTKGLYDIVDTGDGSNWAIRWMLWRVIRQSQSHVQGSRASSLDIQSEFQAGVSTCSTASDYPSIQTPSLVDVASPSYSSPAWMPSVSPYEWKAVESDSDCWDGPPPRKVIKLESTALDHKPTLHNPKSPFWNHVLTAT